MLKACMFTLCSPYLISPNNSLGYPVQKSPDMAPMTTALLCLFLASPGLGAKGEKVRLLLFNGQF